jgi:hypothetical protein
MANIRPFAIIAEISLRVVPEHVAEIASTSIRRHALTTGRFWKSQLTPKSESPCIAESRIE